ncbi:MAG TPA: amidohydrolase [Ignavibacteria bacterium]|nr:amidohydrolase [Ignavibacteria bacterium]
MKTLLTNAKVRLSGNNFVSSVGFDTETGKITFTGNPTETEKIRNEYDEIIDCSKKLVMPAFYEGHCHFIEGAYVNSLLDLRDASTKKDFRERISKYRNAAGVSSIEGGFFAESNFKEEINLDVNFLDSICNDVPLIISRFDTHAAFANSKAIEMSGLLSNECEYTSEEIIKENGVITGELKERARDYVLDSLPKPSLQKQTKVAKELMERFNSYGITSISDITLIPDLEVYKELLNSNSLNLNVDARLNILEFENIEKYKNAFENFYPQIKFKSFKAFYDGSLSSKTAYMHENYKGTNHNGIRTEIVNSGAFSKVCKEIDNRGYQLSVHAIGDKAVTDLLDFNEELIKLNGKKDRRFRIEHSQHITENDFERFRELNVIASVQPSHLFSDAKTASQILEDPSLEHNYDKLFKNGTTVCFGTDFPIVRENPFETIYYAMTRKAVGFEDGFYKEKGISLDDCLDAYTIRNAFASYMEKTHGKIEIGMNADIIILKDDLYEMNAEEIRNAKVETTYFNGRRIYSI